MTITKTYSIASGSDDAYDTYGTFYPSGYWLRFGAAGTFITYPENAYVRFTATDLPKGATIISAKLQFYSYEAATANFNASIKVQDVDDSSPLTSLPSASSFWTTSVSYTPPSWSANTWYDSPDLTTLVQHIVDRSGWTAGNHITFGIFDVDAYLNEYRAITSYEYNATNNCKLVVEYSTYACKTYSIVSGSDDAYYKNNVDAWKYTETATFFGYDSYIGGSEKVDGYVRFQATDLPKNATIVSAKLRFYSNKDRSVTFTSPIEVQDIDDSPSLTSRPTGFWTTQVSYSVPVWAINTWYDSPDIKTLVQHIVDRSGWTAGNHITFRLLWGSDTSQKTLHSFYSYEGNATSNCQLVVEYYSRKIKTYVSNTLVSQTVKTTQLQNALLSALKTSKLDTQTWIQELNKLTPIQLNALLRQSYTRQLQESILASKRVTSNYITDGLLKSLTLKLLTVQSYLQSKNTTKADYDLSIQSLKEEIMSVSSMLQTYGIKENSLSLILKAIGLANYSASALMSKSKSMDLDEDALLAKLNVEQSELIETLIQTIDESDIQLDTLAASLGVDSSVVIDTLLKRLIERYLATDLLTLKQNVGVDAIQDLLLMLTEQKILEADANLQSIQSKLMIIDTILKLIEETKSKTFSIDAILELLGESKSRSFVIETILKLSALKSLSVDSVLKSTYLRQTLTDVMLLYKEHIFDNMDILLKQLGQTKEDFRDALIKKAEEKGIINDSYLASVIKKEISLDELIRFTDLSELVISLLLEYYAQNDIQLDTLLETIDTTGELISVIISNIFVTKLDASIIIKSMLTSLLTSDLLIKATNVIIQNKYSALLKDIGYEEYSADVVASKLNHIIYSLLTDIIKTDTKTLLQSAYMQDVAYDSLLSDLIIALFIHVYYTSTYTVSISVYNKIYDVEVPPFNKVYDVSMPCYNKVNDIMIPDYNLVHIAKVPVLNKIYDVEVT